MKFSVSKCEDGKHLHMGKKRYLWFISVFVLNKNFLLLSLLLGSVQRALKGKASRKVVSLEGMSGTCHLNWAPCLGRDCLVGWAELENKSLILGWNESDRVWSFRSVRLALSTGAQAIGPFKPCRLQSYTLQPSSSLLLVKGMIWRCCKSLAVLLLPSGCICWGLYSLIQNWLTLVGMFAINEKGFA